MSDEVGLTPEGTQPETIDEVAAARRSFLSEPPAILNPDEPVIDTASQDAADEAAALAELTKPPAAPVPGDSAPAATPAAPPGTPDPYEQYGGQEAVQLAWQVQQAMRTEAGVRALAAQSLVTLGYSVEQVQAALAAQEGAPAPTAAPAADDPFAGLEDDDVVNVAQVRQLVEKAAADAASQALAATAAQQQPLQAIVEQQQQQQVQNNTDAALVEVLGPVPTDPNERLAYAQEVDQIVARAAAYYDPAQWANPQHIREAVSRAGNEIKAANEAQFKAYLTKKKAARTSQPVNTGGGAGSDGPIAEPKSMAEARQQARDTGFFQ